jgi:hypothetical protein
VKKKLKVRISLLFKLTKSLFYVNLEKKPVTTTTEKEKPIQPPPPPAKIKYIFRFHFIIIDKFFFLYRHSFYQNDTAVTIQIPIKGLKKEQVQVETTDTTVCVYLVFNYIFYCLFKFNVSTKIPATGNDYSLEIDLAYPIDSSRTNFNVTGSNVRLIFLLYFISYFQFRLK